MGCLEEGCCAGCEYWEDRMRIRCTAASAGVLVSCAWWIFIDAVSVVKHNNDPVTVEAVAYLPAIGATIAFVMINAMDWGALNADDMSYHGGERTAYCNRAILAFALLLGFGSIVGAIMLLKDWAQGDVGGIEPDSVYPGVAVLLSTMLIFIATFVMRLGTAFAS